MYTITYSTSSLPGYRGRQEPRFEGAIFWFAPCHVDCSDNPTNMTVRPIQQQHSHHARCTFIQWTPFSDRRKLVLPAAHSGCPIAKTSAGPDAARCGTFQRCAQRGLATSGISAAHIGDGIRLIPQHLRWVRGSAGAPAFMRLFFPRHPHALASGQGGPRMSLCSIQGAQGSSQGSSCEV